MEMWIYMSVLAISLRSSLAVIYSLNETEYARMPPLYVLEDYPRCKLEPASLYCLLDAVLVSDQPSDLLTMIKEYSAHKMKHFNHTLIHRAICVTRTCKDFYQNTDNTTKMDLKHSLEACLNKTLWEEYKLKVKVTEINHCVNEEEDQNLDLSDVIVLVVYLIILVLNLAGSVYASYLKDEKQGCKYLLAFSLKRNWKKLTSSSGGDGTEPRLERLKLFHGLRTITMICVFFSHSTLILTISYLRNPAKIESVYEDFTKQLLFNGSLVTMTFFVMSAFLLAYNLEMYAESHQVDWTHFPKGMLVRWLRLTPVYGLVLATVSTLVRRMGTGPMWNMMVTSEAAACRQYWWAHLLYVNNYVYHDYLCMPQTWYLAADTQLFLVGLLVCVLARTPRSRKIILIVLFIISLATPALHTYFEDLDAVVIQSPEYIRTLYADDPIFRTVYIRGHTNLSTYTLGLAGGFLTYQWQKTGLDLQKYKNYRFLFWCVFPAGVAIILSGGLFYIDGARAPLYARVLYAMLYKPIFQFLIVAFIIGCIFKFENLYRNIVEWRGFTWTGRVSYSAFLVHTIIQRAYIGGQTQESIMTDYNVVIILSATTLISFISAGVLWLTVEAPLSQVTKAILTPSRKPKQLQRNMADSQEVQSKL